MIIGGFDTTQRVLIIAEAGNNHEGDAQVARALVEQAAAAGADAVKFQTFRADDFVTPTDTKRLEQMRRFELAPEEFGALAQRARELGLLFLSTPLDLGSVAILEPLVDAYKIASGDNDFYPLLDAVAATAKPVIVSAGLAETEQLRLAVDRLRGDVAVLQCVSAYPAPRHEAALGGIAVLGRDLGCTVGYSDHTLGIDIAPLAVAAGARIVEKHFTLDKERSDFRDHALSADPKDFAELVRRIREVEAALGAPEKRVQPSELVNETAVRRSIAAVRDLSEGDRVDTGDLTWLRPGDGLRPGQEPLVVGRTLRRAVARGDQIRLEDLA